MTFSRSSLSSVRFLLVVFAAAVSGCSDASGPNDAVRSPVSEEGGGPVYALMVQIYDPDDRTVYFTLSNSLDFDDVDLTQAREFASVANMAAIGGKLLVSSGTAPTITKFDISHDLEWTELDSVNFMDYPFSDNANFYHQYILNEETAYMPFDVTKRLIWNPDEMAIEDTREDSDVPLEKGGLRAESGGNRNSVRFEGPVQQPFFYTDEDFFDFAQESVVAIYDEETHEEREIVTLPCPGLSMASQDEEGYTYYGTWDFQGTRALFGEGPKPCIARLKPDLTLDEGWTTDLTDLTDGRQVNNFRYIGKGRAIGNVLHHELLEADWNGGYDPDLAETIDAGGEFWKLWLFDLEAHEASPIAGTEEDLSSGAQFAVLDGRTFIFVPYDEWSHTKIYELDDEGSAVERGDVLGDVFKWIRVR